MPKLWVIVGCLSGWWWATATFGQAISDLNLAQPVKDLWHDGLAEVASYDTKTIRYGQKRAGSAVAILVTETFDTQRKVKVEQRNRDSLSALKLNLIRDFPTGIYDYNVMTSSWVGWENRGLATGRALKVSFSSQEWCGHVWLQARFNPLEVAYTGHSYFASEGEEQGQLPNPNDGVPADVLWQWARGLAAPIVKPGSQRQIQLLDSTFGARLNHHPLQWRKATLSVAAKTESLQGPFGSRSAIKKEVSVAGGARYTFWVEQEAPQRILRWEYAAGGLSEVAELVASQRLPYWRMNDPASKQALSKIGLQQRPPRTP